MIKLLWKLVKKNKHDHYEAILVLEMTTEENHKFHLQELEVLDKKRLYAQQRIEIYQAQNSKTFKKKVKERVFEQSDIVLTVHSQKVMTHKSWVNSSRNGNLLWQIQSTQVAYCLAKLDGEILMVLLNSKLLNKCHT